jgi:hypothetical protein
MRYSMTPALWLAVLVGLVALASDAHACPVCGFGRDGTTSAYLMTAALMSLVPLTMAGAFVCYLLRQAKQGRDRS